MALELEPVEGGDRVVAAAVADEGERVRALSILVEQHGELVLAHRGEALRVELRRDREVDLRRRWRGAALHGDRDALGPHDRALDTQGRAQHRGPGVPAPVQRDPHARGLVSAQLDRRPLGAARRLEPAGERGERHLGAQPLAAGAGRHGRADPEPELVRRAGHERLADGQRAAASILEARVDFSQRRGREGRRLAAPPEAPGEQRRGRKGERERGAGHGPDGEAVAGRRGRDQQRDDDGAVVRGVRLAGHRPDGHGEAAPPAALGGRHRQAEAQRRRRAGLQRGDVPAHRVAPAGR